MLTTRHGGMSARDFSLEMKLIMQGTSLITGDHPDKMRKRNMGTPKERIGEGISMSYTRYLRQPKAYLLLASCAKRVCNGRGTTGVGRMLTGVTGHCLCTFGQTPGLASGDALGFQV